MYECCINVCLPLSCRGHKGPHCITVARYDFDPGLSIGDEIYVENAEFIRTVRSGEVVDGDGPKFSFTGQVLRRVKAVRHQAPKDKFLLFIEVEIADKEQIPEIVNKIKQAFPGDYQDYSLETDSKS